MLLHYLGKLKIQIFCRYWANIEKNTNKLHYLCADFNSSTGVTVYAECIYVNRIFEILSIRSSFHCAVCRCLAACQLCLCFATSQQLISTMLCSAFVRTFLCQPICCIPLQIQTFKIKILSSSLNVMLIVAKHCSDVCCDGYRCQLDRKSKEVK